MDGELNYAALLPRTPPEDLVPFLQERGHLQEHRLIYRHEYDVDPATGKRTRAVRAACTACSGSALFKRVTIDRGRCFSPKFGFLHPESGQAIDTGDETVCPFCGAKIKAEHVSLMNRQSSFNGVFALTVGRIADRLTVTQWFLEKTFRLTDGPQPVGEEHIIVYAYEAAVVEEKRLVRISGCYQCMGGTTWYEHWQQRKLWLDKIGKAGVVFPWDPALLTGSTAENSALDKYLSDCGAIAYPTSYLRLWQKHKNVENLVVQGAARLVNEMIKDDVEAEQYVGGYLRRNYSIIPKLPMLNWKERRPAQMLRLTKDEYRECVRMGWDVAALRLYREARARGIRLSLPQDMEDCIAAGSLWCITEMNRGNRPFVTAFLKSARYLRRQRMRHPDGKVTLDGQYLSDYWDMAQRLNMNLTDEHLVYPRDIIAAHDRVMAENQEREEARSRKEREKQEAKRIAENAKYTAQFAELAERLAPLSWEYKGILIRCAATPRELEEEGRALSHCVGGYKNTHAQGKQPIFFIRRAKEPDKPWYTLQLDLKKRTVIQNRGKCNCTETKAVIEFREKWVEHIQNIKLPEKRQRVKVTAA